MKFSPSNKLLHNILQKNVFIKNPTSHFIDARCKICCCREPKISLSLSLCALKKYFHISHAHFPNDGGASWEIYAARRSQDGSARLCEFWAAQATNSLFFGGARAHPPVLCGIKKVCALGAEGGCEGGSPEAHTSTSYFNICKSPLAFYPLIFPFPEHTICGSSSHLAWQP